MKIHPQRSESSCSQRDNNGSEKLGDNCTPVVKSGGGYYHKTNRELNIVFWTFEAKIKKNNVKTFKMLFRK